MVRGGHESLGSSFTDCLGCCECVSAGVMYRGIVRASVTGFHFYCLPQSIAEFHDNSGWASKVGDVSCSKIR